MTKQQIFSSAHANARQIKSINRSRPYKACFSQALQDAWKKHLIATQKLERFIIALAYSETRKRDAVKALGGKYNPATQTWTLETQAIRIKLAGLTDSVANRAPKGQVNSDAGFYMADTARNRANVARYGYDAIEM